MSKAPLTEFTKCALETLTLAATETGTAARDSFFKSEIFEPRLLGVIARVMNDDLTARPASGPWAKTREWSEHLWKKGVLKGNYCEDFVLRHLFGLGELWLDVDALLSFCGGLNEQSWSYLEDAARKGKPAVCWRGAGSPEECRMLERVFGPVGGPVANGEAKRRRLE
jgi:hypothetical protein